MSATLVAVMHVGCGNPVVPPFGNPALDYPLTVGTSWHFTGYSTDSTGARVAGSEYDEIDSVVEADTLLNRRTAVITATVGLTKSITYLSRDDDGDLWIYRDTSGTFGPGIWIPYATFSNVTLGPVSYVRYRAFKSPLVDTLGNVTYLDVFADQTEFYRGVIDVTVPAGVFTTDVRFDSTHTAAPSPLVLALDTRFAVRHFADHVGLVSEVIDNYNSADHRRFPGAVRELTRFSIR